MNARLMYAPRVYLHGLGLGTEAFVGNDVPVYLQQEADKELQALRVINEQLAAKVREKEEAITTLKAQVAAAERKPTDPAVDADALVASLSREFTLRFCGGDSCRELVETLDRLIDARIEEALS